VFAYCQLFINRISTIYIKNWLIRYTNWNMKVSILFLSKALKLSDISLRLYFVHLSRGKEHIEFFYIEILIAKFNRTKIWPFSYIWLNRDTCLAWTDYTSNSADGILTITVKSYTNFLVFPRIYVFIQNSRYQLIIFH